MSLFLFSEREAERPQRGIQRDAARAKQGESKQRDAFDYGLPPAKKKGTEEEKHKWGLYIGM